MANAPTGSPYTAMEWARMARERGLLKHESAWLAEAKRRGEIPSYGDDL